MLFFQIVYLHHSIDFLLYLLTGLRITWPFLNLLFCQHQEGGHTYATTEFLSYTLNCRIEIARGYLLTQFLRYRGEL